MGTGLPFLLLNNSNWANHILDHMNWQSKMQSCWTNFMYFNMPSDSMNYYLPDPNYAAQSCFQVWNQYQEQLRNNNMQFGGYGNFGGYGGYGGYGSPSQIWGFNPSNSNSSSNSNSNSDDPEVIKKKEQYDVLVPILKNIEKSLPNGSILRAEITAALKKTGKIEEKYEALEKVMEKVTSGDNKNSLRTALLQLQDNKLKEGLKKAGYEIKDDDTSAKEKREATKKVEKLRQYIDEPQKAENGATSGATTIISDKTENFIQLISAWNDVYPNEHIINRISTVIKNDENKVLAASLVTNLVHSLDFCVIDLKDRLSSEQYKKLNEQKDVLDKALTNIITKNNNKYENFTPKNLKDLSNKFDKLYSMVRLMEAELVNNKIKENYKDMQDLLGGVTEEEFVVDQVKEDLKKENCNIDNIEIHQHTNDEDDGNGNVGGGDVNVGSGDENVGGGNENVGNGGNNNNSGNSGHIDTKKIIEKNGSMQEIVKEFEMNPTELEGIYEKEGKYYEFEYENGNFYGKGSFKLLEGVTNIDNYGMATKTDGSKERIRDVISTNEAGEKLCKALKGNTSDNSYIYARRILQTITDYSTDEMLEFFRGYNSAHYGGVNCRICARIATENGFTKEEKIEYVHNIVNKVLEIIDSNENIKNKVSESDITILKRVAKSNDPKKWIEATDGLSGLWYSWGWSYLESACNRIDNIIKDIIE